MILLLNRGWYTVMSGIHEAAKLGFTQGSHYDENRPSYTPEVVDQIVKEIQATPDENDKGDFILELGAGTGKFTKLIEKTFKPDKFIATDPSTGFLTTLTERCPGVKTLQCSATDIPLQDHTVKAVICAQCFHWFSNQESLNEIRRVLTNHGKLFLLWNVKDTTVEWVKTFISMIREGYPPSPNVYTMEWKLCIDDHQSFILDRQLDLPGVDFGGSIEFLVNNAKSVSVVSLLGLEEQEQLLDRLRRYLQKVHGDQDYIRVPFKTLLAIYKTV